MFLLLARIFSCFRVAFRCGGYPSFAAALVFRDNLRRIWTRATIEAHRFFFLRFFILGAWSLRPFPKTDSAKKQNMLPDEKIPWPRYTARIMQNKWPLSDHVGLRSPVIQKHFGRKVPPLSWQAC